jgi:hypothetical protein
MSNPLTANDYIIKNSYMRFQKNTVRPDVVFVCLQLVLTIYPERTDPSDVAPLPQCQSQL